MVTLTHVGRQKSIISFLFSLEKTNQKGLRSLPLQQVGLSSVSTHMTLI